MKNRVLYGAIASSGNPEEVATKVKGIVLALSSIIILVAGNFFNIQLGAGDVVTLATELGLVSGAVVTVYGSILHLVRVFGSKKV